MFYQPLNIGEDGINHRAEKSSDQSSVGRCGPLSRKTKSPALRGSKKNWIPVVRGAVYCSPACGGGCTRKDFNRAMQTAQALLRKMKSKGWILDVWENNGWHCALQSKDGLELHVSFDHSGRPSYWCLAQYPLPFGSASGHYKDPNRAVKAALSASLLKVNDLAAKVNRAARRIGIDATIAKRWAREI